MTFLNTEIKKLGRSIQINIHNTRPLNRTPHVCLRHLVDGRRLFGERVYTHAHITAVQQYSRHLHDTVYKFFIVHLKVIRFSFDFMQNGSEFLIFDPSYLILLAPKVTWFIIGTSRLSVYGLQTVILVFLSSKSSFTIAGFILFSVLKISVQRLLSLVTFIVLFLASLRNNYYLIENKGLYFSRTQL